VLVAGVVLHGAVRMVVGVVMTITVLDRSQRGLGYVGQGRYAEHAAHYERDKRIFFILRQSSFKKTILFEVCRE
jgi:hypothetical protein